MRAINCCIIWMESVETNSFSSKLVLKKALPNPPMTIFILDIKPSFSHNDLQQYLQIINRESKMIWDIIQESTFDKHFQNSQLTIQELLVDQNILTEMQNLNPQLLQFINKNIDQIISKLVSYVTIMPREDQGYDRCHRLPYMSSEMLAINSQIFYKAFFLQTEEESRHLKQLFNFLSLQGVDNEVLLGYFQKVTNNLYKGRKLQFTEAVARNLNLFSGNLHTLTIGNILKNCVILIGEKQGILYEERKNIVSTLIQNLVQPSRPQRQSIIREVCSSALVQIIGRHKTFSSGDELISYILQTNGELLIIYSEIEVNQISKFLHGLLTKSTQKIYNPELDTKVNIFKIPKVHENLLQKYLPLRLEVDRRAQNEQKVKIRQQNGQYVNKISKNALDFLSLVAITLQNDIDDFLIENMQYFCFAWKCLEQHPKNDIVLTQITKIFGYTFSERSKNQQKLRNMIVNQFGIVDKLCEIFCDEKKEKLLRPHLFQIWKSLIQYVDNSQKQENNIWVKMCKQYEELIPLYSKASGLEYNRPANAKLVIDQEDNQETEKSQYSGAQAQSVQQNVEQKSGRQDIQDNIQMRRQQTEVNKKGQELNIEKKRPQQNQQWNFNEEKLNTKKWQFSQQNESSKEQNKNRLAWDLSQSNTKDGKQQNFFTQFGQFDNEIKVQANQAEVNNFQFQEVFGHQAKSMQENASKPKPAFDDFSDFASFN